MGPWDPGPGSQIVPDPGPVKCLIGTQPDTGTHQKVRGPKYLDVNMVTNVHVSTKLTVGTSEHSFKSVDEGR